MVEHSTDDRKVLGSIPADTASELFGPFTPLCQRLSGETLKVVGPFYLVSMPGEVKYRTQGVNV